MWCFVVFSHFLVWCPGSVWYLIVSIPDLFLLIYLNKYWIGISRLSGVLLCLVTFSCGVLGRCGT